MEHTAKLTIFSPKKKVFPMSKSFSGFMAIGWKFMKQIDGTQD